MKRDTAISPYSHEVYSCSLFRVGRFQCQPHESLWARENYIGDSAHLVFARVPVEITQAGAAPAIATPNHIMLYDGGQTYRRRPICERGDDSDWIEFSDGVFREAICAADVAAAERPSRFPRCGQMPLTAIGHWCVRQIMSAARAASACPEMLLQESVFSLLHGVIGSSCRQQRCSKAVARLRTQREHRELAHAAQECIARDPSANLSVASIARNLQVSAFHLCRVFRTQVRMSLHEYVVQLRLRQALTQVLDSNSDLTRIAYSAGFSSSAHFSSSFRQAFGVPPSAARSARHDLAQTSKILKARQRGLFLSLPE